MSQRQVLWAAGIAFLALAAALLVWSTRPGRSSDGAPETAADTPAGATTTVTLYFPNGNGRLGREQRELPQRTVAEQCRDIVLAVLGGPEDPDLIAPLPPEIELGGVLLGTGGVAYVELRQPGAERPFSYGSQQERLAIYSLVNSVALNHSLVSSVVLLWNGTQLESFGGHLNTTSPLRPDPTLVAIDP
ncbi:MAG: GerMN domain-containing protein [Acidobacteriota bacterium]|nr:GerMN domain-containing protein [Acidobacteriota bacterium]